MSNLLSITLFLIAAILLYRYHRPVLEALKRFDQRNIAQRQQEMIDRRDQLAHFKHTLKLAEEQVEEIGEITEPDARTGQPVTRYLFEGERFATRAEAERVRAEIVRGKARAFYVELPAALARRGKDRLH